MVIFDNYVSLPEGRCNLMILDVVHTEAEVFRCLQHLVDADFWIWLLPTPIYPVWINAGQSRCAEHPLLFHSYTAGL